MLHRIRYAMAPTDGNPLTGTVECDETYIGRGAPGSMGRQLSGNRSAPFAMVERGGKVRSMVVPSVTARTLKTAIRDNVDCRARLMTDEYGAYKGLDKQFAGHETVRHSAGKYVRGDVYTNTVES